MGREGKMRSLPKAGRFYLMSFENKKDGKTHLMYFEDFIAKIVCMPFLFEVEVGSKCEGFSECSIEDAERWDDCYDTLTCPTCLKIAQGRLPSIKNQVEMPLFPELSKG